MNAPTPFLLPTPRRLLAVLAEGVRTRRRLHLDRGQLLAMNDRELSDLGVGRGELAHRLRMPPG